MDNIVIKKLFTEQIDKDEENLWLVFKTECLKYVNNDIKKEIYKTSEILNGLQKERNFTEIHNIISSFIMDNYEKICIDLINNYTIELESYERLLKNISRWKIINDNYNTKHNLNLVFDINYNNYYLSIIKVVCKNKPGDKILANYIKYLINNDDNKQEIIDEIFLFSVNNEYIRMTEFIMKFHNYKHLLKKDLHQKDINNITAKNIYKFIN